MRRRALPAWAVSYYWGKNGERRRHFKTWAIPRDQITDAVSDHEWFRVQITGPSYAFSGTVKLTSGEEVPLRKVEREALQKAMRKHPNANYRIVLVAKAPGPKA